MTKHQLKTEHEWLALRKTIITATESSAILGLNKYLSASQMSKNKVENSFTGNAYTQIGSILEPAVVNAVNLILGTQFYLLENEYGKIMYLRDDVPIGATPDATNGLQFLECKTTNPTTYLRYRFSPPEYYVFQLMVQLYCAGLTEGYLAIMSTNLTQTKAELNIPISIFRVLLCPELCAILKSEVERYFELKAENKMFRVNSKIKQLSRLLVKFSYIQVY